MTMQLTLRELRSIIREAVGDRGWPGDKAHLICFVLSKGGGPMTRPEVMEKVHALEGNDPANFRASTNNCYWSPKMMTTGDWVQDPDRPDDHFARVRINPRQVPNTCAGEAAKFSVLRRGLVQLAGKRGHALVYTLTPAGQKFAAEAEEWMRSRPDLFDDNLNPVPGT